MKNIFKQREDSKCKLESIIKSQKKTISKLRRELKSKVSNIEKELIEEIEYLEDRIIALERKDESKSSLSYIIKDEIDRQRYSQLANNTSSSTDSSYSGLYGSVMSNVLDSSIDIVSGSNTYRLPQFNPNTSIATDSIDGSIFRIPYNAYYSNEGGSNGNNE